MAEEKAEKEAVKATLQALAKPETPKEKAPAVKTTSDIQVKTEAPKPVVKEPAKTVPEAAAKPEAPEAEEKAEDKKEADASKEFVDAIMTEMALKGVPKKRLIKKLAEKYNFDKQRVLFKLKRALITERYAAGHAEAGH
ncbi:MAG: hypothetical protein L6244_03915 [Candidatus Methanoperedenaceae archaeon]|nr:hypothetical protein [Candidatus Methanoperedenaceae archaeon]